MYIVPSLIVAVLLINGQHSLAQLSFGDCAGLPDEGTLESLIATSFTVGGFGLIQPPAVEILDLNYVCLASGTLRDTYRVFSVVVRYNCAGLACPATRPVSQFDFSCSEQRVWSDVINEGFHRDSADADLNTPNRTNCSLCFASDHPLLDVIRDVRQYDSTTHCVGESV